VIHGFPVLAPLSFSYLIGEVGLDDLPLFSSFSLFFLRAREVVLAHVEVPSPFLVRVHSEFLSYFIGCSRFMLPQVVSLCSRSDKESRRLFSPPRIIRCFALFSLTLVSPGYTFFPIGLFWSVSVARCFVD